MQINQLPKTCFIARFSTDAEKEDYAKTNPLSLVMGEVKLPRLVKGEKVYLVAQFETPEQQRTAAKLAVEQAIRARKTYQQQYNPSVKHQRTLEEMETLRRLQDPAYAQRKAEMEKQVEKDRQTFRRVGPYVSPNQPRELTLDEQNERAARDDAEMKEEIDAHNRAEAEKRRQAFELAKAKDKARQKAADEDVI